MANELLPCPFCGACANIEKIGRDWWRLTAQHGYECALDSGHRLNAPQTDAGLAWLVAVWNLRVTPAQRDTPTDAEIIATFERHTRRDGYADGTVVVDYLGAAKELLRRYAPAQDAERERDARGQEPIAWESMTPVYFKYITDSRYKKFSPTMRKWYRPYRCTACGQDTERKQDAERYLILRDQNGFSLDGKDGIGRFQVSRKERPGEAHYYGGASLDQVCDAARAQRAAAQGDA